ARAVVSELDDRILDPASATLELHGFGQRVEAFRGKGLERLRPGRRAEGRRRLTPVPAIPSVVRRPDDELATTVFGLPDVDENAGWVLGFVPGPGLGGSIQARIGEVEHRAPFESVARTLAERHPRTSARIGHGGDTLARPAAPRADEEIHGE